jgi:beta-glucosidase
MDEAIRGDFRVMIRLGMLDPAESVPYSSIGTGEDPWLSEKHRSFARTITEKSAVLLKNEGGLLPLDAKNVKSIAVVGNRAETVLFDWYSGSPPYFVTPLDGIVKRAGKNVAVRCAKDNTDGAAARLAAESDVAIVCVGNHPTGDSDEFGVDCVRASDGKEAVDRKSILLEDEELIKQVFRANRNTVVCLISSFPFAVVWTKHNVPAILHITQNSQELGTALAAAIFGDVNPAGRLVQTWPSSEAQLPAMMDYDIRNGRTHMYFKGEPLFPFGFGLSYTRFEYSDLRISSDRITGSSEVTLSLAVKNVGKRDGDEVVQLYVRHLDSGVPRPLKELKGFARVTVAAGKKETVKIVLKGSSLAYWDAPLGGWRVEAGRVMLMVGASSADIRQETILTVAP